MAVLYLAGDRQNIAEWGTITVNPAADSLWPSTYLYDDLGPATPFKYGTNVADSTIQVYAESITNGGFETASLAGWTDENTGTGVSAEDAVEHHSGSKSLRCNGGAAGEGVRTQTFLVAAGERRKLTVWIKNAGTVSVIVRNLANGKYLGADGAWYTTTQTCLSGAAADWTEKTISFFIESWADVGTPTPTLKIYLKNAGNYDGYFDDVSCVKYNNFASMHGHNFECTTPTIQHSQNGSAWTAFGEIPKVKPSSYYYNATAVAAPYWRLLLSGTAVSAQYLGHLCFGYAQTLTQPQNWGWEKEFAPNLIDLETQGQGIYRSRRSDQVSRELTMTFSQDTLAAYGEIENAYLQTYGGQKAIVIVPMADESAVIHGHFAEARFRAKRDRLVGWSDTVTIRESGFPPIGV